MLWVFIVVVNSQLSDFGKDLLQNSSDTLLPEVTGTGLLGTVSHLFGTDRYKLQELAILVHVSGTSQSLGLLGDFVPLIHRKILIKLNRKPLISMEGN